MVMNPDISKERNNSSCTPEDLTILILGGVPQYERRKFIESVISADPLFDDRDRYQQTTCELYDVGVRRAIRWQNIREEHHLEDDDTSYFKSIFVSDLAFHVHGLMFVPTIRRLANPEQLARWLPLAESRRILGTYAQTELGHGSYLNGLETTATFDKGRQEFVLNSPSLSSMKWWPGGLGLTVNHAVIVAQLVVDGKKCGAQAFMLQVRDMDTHQPMPGCQLGDIGPKWGGNGMSNGYLRLDNVRIPRDNMLMKYTEILPDGHLLSRGNPKVVYGSMVLMRANLVQASAIGLSMAVTIAIRYSAVRKQGTIDASVGEVPILDYQSQQEMLFPLLASSYCFLFVAQKLRRVYENSESLIKDGNFSQLPELHSLTCALKAYCCYYMSEGIRTCIYASGGHGYLLSSGLPWLYEYHSVMSTVEGTKQVMYQQTARLLIKSLGIRSNEDTMRANPTTTDYLQSEVTDRWPATYKGHVRNYENLIKALQHRAQRLVKRAAGNLRKLKREGLSQGKAWNETQVDLIAAAEAHAELYCVEVFCEKVENLFDVSPAIRGALNRLCLLHALHIIRSNSGEFLEDKFISGQQMTWVKEEYFDLLSKIRPDAVVLVDGFDYSDATLRSTLGSYDGNAYERLYESTKDELRNEKPVHDVFHKYLQPFMREQAKL